MRELSAPMGIPVPRNGQSPHNQSCIVRCEQPQKRQHQLLILVLRVQYPARQFAVVEAHYEELDHPEPVAEVLKHVIGEEEPVKGEEETLQSGTVENTQLVETPHMVVVVFRDLPHTQTTGENGDYGENDEFRTEVPIPIFV